MSASIELFFDLAHDCSLCRCTDFGVYVTSAAQRGTVEPISAALCDNMKSHHVLNPGAPVGCDRLKLIKFDYFGFDRAIHNDGEIVVMDAVARQVLRIFTTLRKMRFPIAKAKLMDVYDGNDLASMADNNTSAFNDRQIVGGSQLSLHAYGLAIDINPVQNPYAVRSGLSLIFSPPSGIDYANRLNERPGKARRIGLAETIVDVFANNGFVIWGGYWDDPIDYQHFQLSRTMAELLARLPPEKAAAEFNKYIDRLQACQRASHHKKSSRLKCALDEARNTNHIGD